MGTGSVLVPFQVLMECLSAGVSAQPNPPNPGPRGKSATWEQLIPACIPIGRALISLSHSGQTWEYFFKPLSLFLGHHSSTLTLTICDNFSWKAKFNFLSFLVYIWKLMVNGSCAEKTSEWACQGFCVNNTGKQLLRLFPFNTPYCSNKEKLSVE